MTCACAPLRGRIASGGCWPGDTAERKWLTLKQAQALLSAPDITTQGLRDRAIIGRAPRLCATPVRGSVAHRWALRRADSRRRRQALERRSPHGTRIRRSLSVWCLPTSDRAFSRALRVVAAAERADPAVLFLIPWTV